MRIGVSGNHRRSLARGAAVLLVGGLAAGCSSDVTRFQDSIFTGSSRPDALVAPVQQAYPGNVDTMATGSVTRSQRTGGILGRAGLIPRPQADVDTGGVMMAARPPASVPNNPYPVGQGTYASAQPAYPSPASQAVTSASLPPVAAPRVDTTTTGSTPPTGRPVAIAAQPMPAVAPERPQNQTRPAPQPAVVAAQDAVGGWSRTGGTQVALRQGETIYNLSKRFGVPADAIVKTNGLRDASAVAAGDVVVIPTYVHSARAPVSAPDANPNVADARSSNGSRTDAPANAPIPGQTPAERLAVLPQPPRQKEVDPGQQQASSTGAQPTAQAGGYTVVSGDTLHGIAKKTGVSTEALKQANGLSTGLIRIGQKLVIPAGGGATQTQVAAATPKVDQTTTAGTAKPAVTAYTPPKQAENAIRQASLDTSAPAPDATGIGKMRWPVRGRVISGFGGASGGKKNDGIDIAVPAGTPVKAAENGVVIYAGDGLKEFGNTVLVRHEDGLVTVYGHASEINVTRGQKVRRGEEIAKAGMSGSADSPKLHFEVRKDSAPVDPKGFLE